MCALPDGADRNEGVCRRFTGGLEHLLSLVLLAVIFAVAPQGWSLLETFLAAVVAVAAYEGALAARDRRLRRRH